MYLMNLADILVAVMIAILAPLYINRIEREVKKPRNRSVIYSITILVLMILLFSLYVPKYQENKYFVQIIDPFAYPNTTVGRECDDIRENRCFIPLTLYSNIPYDGNLKMIILAKGITDDCWWLQDEAVPSENGYWYFSIGLGGKDYPPQNGSIYKIIAVILKEDQKPDLKAIICSLEELKSLALSNEVMIEITLKE